ncbi:MAG: class I SAM-dependent methyltransferase [Chlorobi bacterium]|nr:class I SAM-dependent methyltransferase [Chlorobiota bacterium]MCI0714811.1 class I SAM-dependent methyltransferase [Chlorobiota bacterium]
MNYNKLPKDVLSVIRPPIWDAYYYVSSLTRKAYEKTVPVLLKSNTKYNILDFGCGAKPYEYLFEGYINKYVGVDVGENPKAEINIVPGEKLPFNDNEFDIILSSQVLEHVENVEQYMNECRRVLRGGGHLLLSTHGTWQYHASPYDYYRWTRIGLNYLLESHGFIVEKCTPILGQLAITSQLRLSFYHSFANMTGTLGKVLLAPVSLFYQLKMMLEDLITPKRVKERDSAIFLMIARKK